MTSANRLRIAKLRSQLQQSTPTGLSGRDTISALAALLTYWPDEGFTPEQRALLERAATANVPFAPMAAQALRGDAPWTKNP